MTQLPLDLIHRTALGRADFLVAPCNAAALAWLDRWPHWPGPALALYGPERSGKTHLAEVWRARAGAVLIEPVGLASALVAERLGAARAAVIDDAERADEEALLHLYNLLAERQGHLLVVARQPPAHWQIALADLRSRLLAAPAVAVEPPDEAVLGAVLVKLFADRQLTVGEGVIPYLLVQLERSFAAAEAAVAALDAASLADRRAITVPLARQVLTRLGARGPG
ncbi:MAG TPA: DnaA/Hda family protein [Stellaceae bacterium]|nr:DnaA/Hda family protein [Stellaceae bacterium]